MGVTLQEPNQSSLQSMNSYLQLTNESELSLTLHDMPGDKKALLLVDIQYDFLPPQGALAVPDGDMILPHIYELLEHGERYDIIVASMVSVGLALFFVNSSHHRIVSSTDLS